MTALPQSGSFVMVDPSHVEAVGLTAATVYARILWRTEQGPWRASRAQLAAEVGLTVSGIRRAVEVLREAEWITTERASTLDATLVWGVVLPGGAENAQSALSRMHPVPTPLHSVQDPPDESALSSYETGETLETETSAVAAVPPLRDDVESLCTHLADRIEGNGSKRPQVTKAWRDAARLMLDRDARELDKVHRAIDWCQDDDFWRANVLSMPTLRRQYDKLRLAAQRAGGGAGRPRTRNHLLDLQGRGQEALDGMLQAPAPFPARPALEGPRR